MSKITNDLFRKFSEKKSKILLIDYSYIELISLIFDFFIDNLFNRSPSDNKKNDLSDRVNNQQLCMFIFYLILAHFI